MLPCGQPYVFLAYYATGSTPPPQPIEHDNHNDATMLPCDMARWGRACFLSRMTSMLVSAVLCSFATGLLQQLFRAWLDSRTYHCFGYIAGQLVQETMIERKRKRKKKKNADAIHLVEPV